MVPNIIWLQIWHPMFAEKPVKTIILEVTPKNGRQNVHDKFLRKFGKFGQKSFAPPKICLLLHLWVCDSMIEMRQWHRGSGRVLMILVVSTGVNGRDIRWISMQTVAPLYSKLQSHKPSQRSISNELQYTAK